MTLAQLFFDLDHTLWDFETNSRLALSKGSGPRPGILGSGRSAHVDPTLRGSQRPLLGRIQGRQMDKATCVADGLNWRWRLVVRAPGLPGQMGSITWPTFTKTLIPGTLEVLETLRARGHRMWVLTNGFDEVQHLKMDNCNLTPFSKASTPATRWRSKSPTRSVPTCGTTRGVERCRIRDGGDGGGQFGKRRLGRPASGWRVHFTPAGERHPEAWRTIQRLPELLDLELKA